MARPNATGRNDGRVFSRAGSLVNAFRATAVRGGGMNRLFQELMDDPILTHELNEAAKAVRQRAQLTLTGSARSGRVYSGTDFKGNKYRNHRASAPGEPPASLTGYLAKSLRLKRATKRQTRKVAKVSVRAPHAHLLEFGTVNMAPRPFLGPALNQARAATFTRLKGAALRSVRAAARKAKSQEFIQ